jgi:hypothetical protein
MSVYTWLHSHKQLSLYLALSDAPQDDVGDTIQVYQSGLALHLELFQHVLS